MSVVFAIAALAATAAGVRPPITPATAVALADAHRNRGTSGVFEMTAVATDRTDKGVFINSTDDYRRPDDLTFAISLAAARSLEKRFGAPPEVFFRGKHVVVAGAVRAVPIVNMLYGKPRSFNRYGHEVRIDQANQIIAVD